MCICCALPFTVRARDHGRRQVPQSKPDHIASPLHFTARTTNKSHCSFVHETQCFLLPAWLCVCHKPTFWPFLIDMCISWHYLHIYYILDIVHKSAFLSLSTDLHSCHCQEICTLVIVHRFALLSLSTDLHSCHSMSINLHSCFPQIFTLVTVHISKLLWLSTNLQSCHCPQIYTFVIIYKSPLMS